MAGLKLRVQGEGLTGAGYRVWLDGREVSHGLQGLQLSYSPDEVTMATLSILVNALEVDGDVLAFLEAHVKEPIPVGPDPGKPRRT